MGAHRLLVTVHGLIEQTAVSESRHDYYSPSYNLHVGVTLWSAGDDKLSEDAREGRNQFQQAWRWLDSLSPYSILEHHRQRR